jgi:hypothetical protein
MKETKSSFMDELDTVLAESQRVRGCAVATIAFELSPEDRADLSLALANPKYTSKAIQVVLTKRGYSISPTSVGRHRRKDCCCESW